MKKSFVAGLSLVVLFGCTSSDRPSGAGGGGSTETGGSTGSGGSPGSGGTSETGGSTGSGGSTDTGGGGTTSTGGSGGSTGAGGATGGSGGIAATGGATGTGGATATGGGGGTANGGSTGGGGTTGTGGSGGATGTGGVVGPNNVPSTYAGGPYGGTPQPIPGMIQIESYDTGGANVAYKVSGNVKGSTCGFTRTDLIDLQCTGQNGSPKDQTQGTCAALTGDVYLGYIGTGDWLNYTVNVKQAGTYAISTHVGVNGGNTKLMFTFTPTVKTAALALMGTSGCGVESYHVWATENIGMIDLQPGTYVMRLDFVAAGLNIDWVAFTKM